MLSYDKVGFFSKSKRKTFLVMEVVDHLQGLRRPLLRAVRIDLEHVPKGHGTVVSLISLGVSKLII
jgi:hypothetical protein